MSLLIKFIPGIEENAALLKEFYNETWVMRLYYDIDPDSMLHNQLCEIACYYDNLDLCNIRFVLKKNNMQEQFKSGKKINVGFFDL